MIVFGKWHGGINYAGVDKAEEFSTMEDARTTFQARIWGEYGYPCVEDSSMYLYRDNPDDVDDAEPFKVLKQGPRNGFSEMTI